MSTTAAAGKSLLRLLLAVALGSTGGCVPALMTVRDHTVGRWAGVVEPIKLRDRSGRLYDGIVLANPRGTPMTTSVDPALGGGHAPILVRQQGDSNLRALVPDALPPGRRVSVRGTESVLTVFARLADTGGGDVAVSRNERPPGYPSADHVLIVADWQLMSD